MWVRGLYLSQTLPGCSVASRLLRAVVLFRPVITSSAGTGAGQNLLLCSAQDPTEGQAVVTALAGALDSGQPDSTAFNAAVQRVTTLRSGL